jgi:hypothetical protein
VFQFFLFDGTTEACSFSRGTLPGDPPAHRHGFRLDDFKTAETPRPFLCDLRPICEIIFDLLLKSYISSLDAYYKRSVSRSNEEGMPTNSTELEKWEQALGFSGKALEMFRVAEAQRQNQLSNDANATVQSAMEFLKRRYGSSTSNYCNAPNDLQRI